MKVENMMRRIVARAGGLFDKYGFMNHDEGFDAALTYYYIRRVQAICKNGGLYGEVTNFRIFCYELGQILEMPSGEVARYLRGSYRNIFEICTACGLNNIELK